jgi:glycine cleavage system H protein
MSSGKEIKYPADRKYTESHEWAMQDGDTITVGISDYAQDALGDVVFVELPAVGANLEKGKALGVVESVKAASDIYSPVTGEVVAINEKLTESPDLLNRDALVDGWMVKVRPSAEPEFDALMDSATYRQKIEAGELH